MKKALVLIIITGLLSFNGYAQFGVRAGVDLAKVKVEVSNSYESISTSENYTGFYVGVFSKLYISENFNLRPELNYFHFSKEESSNLVDHIQVPLLLGVNFGNQVELLVGPSASYLFNVQGDAKSFNYSGNLGLVIKINEFQIEGRFVKGFANLSDVYDTTMNLDAMHIGITYSVN